MNEAIDEFYFSEFDFLDSYFKYKDENEKPLLFDEVYFILEGVQIFGSLNEEFYDINFGIEDGFVKAFKSSHIFDIKLDTDLGSFEILTLPFDYILENAYFLKKDDNRRVQFTQNQVSFNSRIFSEFVNKLIY